MNKVAAVPHSSLELERPLRTSGFIVLTLSLNERGGTIGFEKVMRIEQVMWFRSSVFGCMNRCNVLSTLQHTYLNESRKTQGSKISDNVAPEALRLCYESPTFNLHAPRTNS